MARVAFVTGAASGLGRGIAERMAADGFRVAVADIDDAGAQKVIADLPTESVSVHCDVTDIGSVEAAVADVEALLGPIDALVNNAGFDRPNFFLQTDPSEWKDLIAVNLFGVLNCIYVLAPKLIERSKANGYARIVNIASDAGRVGALGEAVYSSAKGGVIAFSKSIARELARDRVTVNAVCPGPADTPMTDAIKSTEIGAMMMDRIVASTPLRRLASAGDVAAAVAYFCSEEAAFVTGQSLSISGGLTMA